MHKEERRIILSVATTVVASLVLLFAGFGGGYLYASEGSASLADQPTDVDFSPVWKAWNIINEKFVPAAVATSSPIATSTAEEDQRKVYGMIGGLAASLNDPYTFFLPPTENQQFASDMSGSFEGVGMEIEVKDQVLTVVTALKGTPAEAAGIKSGDQVLKINGTSTEGMDTSTAVNLIRGQKGSKVTLTIARAAWPTPRDIKVTRETINVPTVITTARPDGVFVIQLQTFTSNSPDLFRNALRGFVQSGDTKLVLDLRGNPGGYLEAAVDIASWFLPSGDTVVTEDYAGHEQNIVHRSLGFDVFNKNLHMIILVDHGSASASEILADALHYWGVAKLVGTNTFGKGSVQELIDITPGTALKVTVARWLGPDGIQIPRAGIKPDINVELTDADHTAGRDPQMNKAIELLTGTSISTSTTAH